MTAYTTVLNDDDNGTVGTGSPMTTTGDTFYITLFKGAVDIVDNVTGEKVLSISSPFDSRRGAKGFTFGTGFVFNVVATIDGTSCGASV